MNEGGEIAKGIATGVGDAVATSIAPITTSSVKKVKSVINGLDKKNNKSLEDEKKKNDLQSKKILDEQKKKKELEEREKASALFGRKIV